jgi:hypothetical protein
LTETKRIKEIINSRDTAEVPPSETAASGARAEAIGSEALTKPFKIRKRIGYTTYEVEVRFNANGRETLDDKILRLVRGEAMKDGEETL